MTHCAVAATTRRVAPPLLGTRFLQVFFRFFTRSVVTREAIDHAWIDAGLGRLDRRTLQDIGAPPTLIDEAQRREAWKLAAALDATRHL